ncbi:MAG: ABC transporter permease [Lysobacteraceae bacterium]
MPADSIPQTTLEGDWTLEHLGDRLAFAQSRARAQDESFDVGRIARLDTAGATVLLDLIGGIESIGRLQGLHPHHEALLRKVASVSAKPPPQARHNAFTDVLAQIGESVLAIRADSVRLLGFIGLVLESLARVVVAPWRWRPTALAAQIEQTGLNAVPIVALLTFLVGCVVAFLGATVLRDFGATVYTVELIGYAFLREFGVLLTAILVAGRSGSAFTAALGSMKSREEIDAIRTLGLSPIEVLVIPRVLALLVSLPVLTFIGMMAGLVGGGVVCMWALDVSPVMYVTRLYETTEIRHFWVGMSKAPLFAFLIACIGCLEGFKVSGSAESVGKHTTSSVVQSIFVVILIDALAAIFFMEIDL